MSTSTNLTVEIWDSALSYLTLQAQRSTDGLETGGILLGYDTPNGILIRYAGDPGPHAERGPRHFNRDLAHAQRLANTAWNRDGSRWIGEWHTHPAAGPTPSELDLNSYLRHIHDPDLGFEKFVAIIVTLDPTGMNAVPWIIDRHAARPAQLRTTSD